MFWNRKYEMLTEPIETIKSLKEENLKLKEELKLSKESIIFLSNSLNNQQKKEKDENDNASIVIDFKTMKAFSIERLFDLNTNEWDTVIGFWKEGEKDSTGEWHLHITLEKHEELCKEFKAYLKLKSIQKEG